MRRRSDSAAGILDHSAVDTHIAFFNFFLKFASRAGAHIGQILIEPHENLLVPLILKLYHKKTAAAFC